MKRLFTLCLLLAATIASAQLDAIRTLTPEQGQEVRRPIEAEVFGSAPENFQSLEAELLDLFQDPETTLEGKQYTCRMLRFCASAASVPVLEKELLNPELSHFVRFVFQGLESREVDTALLAALPAASDQIKIGIIGTLGQRGTKKAVAAIAPALESENTELQLAAITALGNIGGRKAGKALAHATVAPALSKAWKQARIQAAEGVRAYPFGLFSSGSAKAVCTALREDDNADIRSAALIGLTKAGPKKAAPIVLAALDDAEPRLRNTAISLLPLLPTDQLCSVRLGMKAETQVLLINELARRGASEAEEALLAATANENKTIRTAAIQALGKIGGTRTIERLIAEAPTDADAFAALCSLPAAGTDAALIQALETANDDQVKVRYIECLTRRQAPAALPLFKELASKEWNRVTAAAINGLPPLVSAADFETCTKLMLAADNPKKIKALEKSMALAARYQRNPAACSEITAAAYPKAEGEAKYALIRVLGSIGGPEADRILSEAQNSTDPKAKDAAIRGLCASPNASVAGELLKLAETSDSTTYKVLALRGYIRLAKEQKPAQRLDMCVKAAALTDRTAELKSIIACAKTVRDPKAVELIASLVDKPDLINDCGWALIELSWGWNCQPASLAPLKRVLELSDDDNLKTYAADRVKTIGKTR